MQKIVSSLVAFFLIGSFALPAGASVERLTRATESLNDTIRKANLDSILSDLAAILSIESTNLAKALLEDQRTLGDIALAKFVHDQTEQPIQSILTQAKDADWLAVLHQHNLGVRDAEEHLEMVQADVAFLLLDLRQKKRR